MIETVVCCGNFASVNIFLGGGEQSWEDDPSSRFNERKIKENCWASGVNSSATARTLKPIGCVGKDFEAKPNR